MVECDKCEDKGFIQLGEGYKKCSCRIKKEVRSYLPKVFRDNPVAKKFPFSKFSNINIRTKGSVTKFGSLANTLLLHHYLRNSKFTYEVVGYTTFVEKFFEGEVDPYYSTDLLILLVYGGYTHSKTGEYLFSLLKDRELTKKSTLVFIDSDFRDSEVKKRLGDQVYAHINKFSAVTI